MISYHGNEVPKKQPQNVTAMTISPDDAQRIIQRKKWDRQRNLRHNTVSLYARLMSSGKWQQMSVIRFAVLGENEYLIDGQHRLHAIVSSGQAQQFVVIRQHVSNLEELALQYSAVDRGLSRTGFDMLHALGVDDFYGWNKTVTNLISSGCTVINQNFTRPGKQDKLSGAELAELISKYADGVTTYVDIYELSTSLVRDGMRRRATSSVGIVTLHESVEQYGNKVVEFWEGIAYDSGLSKGDPRKLVVDHLKTTKVSGGKASGGVIVDPYYSCRYIAQCFNAYVEGRELSKTMVKGVGNPIKILGSSFKG